MLGLIAKKIGMTQILDHVGDVIPVTVLQCGPNVVTALRTKAKEGYDAVQVGFQDAKERLVTKSQLAQFKKNEIKPKKYLREFRVPATAKIEDFKVGQEILADFFEEGEFVDVQGTSIGKGFAGGIKRWHMKGGPESHGSMYHRRAGSQGSTTTPGRTWRGHHAPGHMGDETKTVQNLLVMKVLKDDNAILVRGAVPGSRNAIILVRKALKRKKIDLLSLKAAHAGGDKKDAKKAAPAKKPAAKK